MANETTVRVGHDSLVLGPVRITFQRTLRIPESGLHDLPPSLGAFPIRRVTDYPDTAPREWLERGGVMLPIFQREAMWLSFDSDEPAAVQVGVGKVCAISGETWTEELRQHPQNYAALPEQPWLDGINAGDGFIRQFVAVPLGLGATVEGQVTGQEVHGGVQLRAVGATAAALNAWRETGRTVDIDILPMALPPIEEASMGLGAGGRMRQEIYTDDRELADYDASRSWRVFVHLCSAAQWTAITGEVPPPTPVDRETYVQHRLPWFHYYDEDRNDLPASDTLSKAKTVGDVLDEDDEAFIPVDPATVVKLKHAGFDDVPPGSW